MSFDRGASSASGADTETVLISDSDDEGDECVVLNDTRAAADVESAASGGGVAFGTRIRLCDMPVLSRPELPCIHTVSLRTVTRPSTAQLHGTTHVPLASAVHSLSERLPTGANLRFLPSPPAQANLAGSDTCARPHAEPLQLAKHPPAGQVQRTMPAVASLAVAPGHVQRSVAAAPPGGSNTAVKAATRPAETLPRIMPPSPSESLSPPHAAASITAATVRAAQPGTAATRAPARTAPKRGAPSQQSGSAKARARGNQPVVQPPDPPGPQVIAAHLARFKPPRRVAVYWLEAQGGGTWYKGDAVSASRTSIMVRYDSDGSRDVVDIREESVGWLD